MYTKFKTDRQVIFPTIVLLTAMSLSLTAVAQDFSKTVGHAQHAVNTTDNCVHCLTMHRSPDYRNCQHSHNTLTIAPDSENRAGEDGVGFAETDPSTLQSLSVPTFFSRSTQQAYAGFAEYDPADWQPLETMTFLQASSSQVQEMQTGFAETDPSAISDPIFCIMDNAKMSGFRVG